MLQGADYKNYCTKTLITRILEEANELVISTDREREREGVLCGEVLT